MRHRLEIARQLREVAQEGWVRHGLCVEQEDRPFPVSEGGVVALVLGEIGIVSQEPDANRVVDHSVRTREIANQRA